MVRGLDYYTRTTFEVILGGLGAQNSVAGGGRYDGLVEDLGGKPTQAIGFALGLDRLILALPESAMEESGICVFIVAMNDVAFDYSFANVQLPMRQAGIRCEIDYQKRGLKGGLRQADKRQVEWTIVVGEDEMQSGNLTLKNMKSGEQQKLSIQEIIGKLK
jgi:histidyl-tRNA synthetase